MAISPIGVVSPAAGREPVSVPGPVVEPFAAAVDRASAALDGRGTRPGRAQVAAERTPLSGEQAATALASAYRERRGSEPSPETLAILTSHWSLETGQGASMYNFNFAGIKGTSPQGLTTVMRTREGHGASEVHIRDGFRAYRSADEGASDYLGLLERRYGAALSAAEVGDAASFVRELKSGGYFTGDERSYERGLVRLANRAMEYGVNAIGGSAGALAAQPMPTREYFTRSEGSRGDNPRGMAELHGASAHWAPGVAAVDSMSEAVVRAALSIASTTGRQRSERSFPWWESG